ncbi:unnamed protein product [Toxocara canis]|uniref:Secreted protein n=1 Tax=Toxocara canis TaxID=6265 RepID=A0A183VD11_TOXCA|nr:unnamed protein product [Toxocara canis]
MCSKIVAAIPPQQQQLLLRYAARVLAAILHSLRRREACVRTLRTATPEPDDLPPHRTKCSFRVRPVC